MNYYFCSHRHCLCPAAQSHCVTVTKYCCPTAVLCSSKAWVCSHCKGLDCESAFLPAQPIMLNLRCLFLGYCENTLLVPVIFWFFMSQKFFTTKSHITKMFSGIIAPCMAKKGNTTGSECYFQLFTREMVKSFPAGLTAPVVLSDCCHTTCFSPEYFMLMLQSILTCVLRTTSETGPFSLWWLCWDNH